MLEANSVYSVKLILQQANKLFKQVQFVNMQATTYQFSS